MREDLIKMYKNNMDMEVVELWDVILEDDDTETGGVAYKNQTVGELLIELSDSEVILDVDFNRLNTILKECGIKQIEKPKFKEDKEFKIDEKINNVPLQTGKVMYVYGKLETEGRIDVGDIDLGEMYRACKEIAIFWKGREDIQSEEEEENIVPHAERWLLNLYGIE